MAIDSFIIDEAIEILERDGVVFGDSSKVGIYLESSARRRELEEHISRHFEFFQQSIECQSLRIISQGNYYYFIFVWDIIENLYPQFEYYKEVIKEAASIHYNVPKDDISFDFM